MGKEDTETPTKTPTSASSQEQNQTPKISSAQEQPPPSSPATVFPDWASYQAYYNSVGTPSIPPPGFFHSSAASSPQAHSYMWGQHMMPPYGTPPPPYVAMYPPGGIYGHPSMPPGSHPYGPYAMLSPNGTAEAPATGGGDKELDGKSAESKGKIPLKRSKGSLGSLNMLTGKGSEIGKASGASDNGGGFSQSGESGGEGSSEGSDANSQNGSQQSEKGSADAEGQNGGSVSSGANHALITVPPTSVSGPTTNLNIGMDYWGGPASSQVATARAKLPVVPASAAIVPSGVVGSRDGIPPELWIQDERELKRQRRKQSNRESARRSRLRKQAEYDDLAQRVETLKEENSALREELERMREECEKLTSENASLTDKLQNHLGQGSRVDGLHGQPESDPQVAVNIDPLEKDC